MALSLRLPRTIPPPPGTPPIRTDARSATILPNFVGLRFAVHNGKSYVDLYITDQMGPYTETKLIIGLERDLSINQPRILRYASRIYLGNYGPNVETFMPARQKRNTFKKSGNGFLA
ncbi:mitochondrial ribosomal small subunit component [Ophidiomyces ophidiicola]|nr:mitochondrial ribosomal small subunit component [Ophidiomyces ophidiicola]